MKKVVINAEIRKFATLEIEVSDEDYAALQTDAASNIIGGDLDLACQLPRPVKGSGLAKHAAIVHDKDYTVHDDEGEPCMCSTVKRRRFQCRNIWTFR